MSNKELVIDVVSQLPDDASMQQIAREVELLAGIEAGSEQALRGEGVSIEEARQLVKEWAHQ